MRNTVAKVTGIVLVTVGLFGCGGSSEQTPQEKCEDLGETLCARAVECIAEFSGMQNACVQAWNSSAQCSRTKSVGATYNACIDAMNSSSCSRLFPRDASGDPEITLPATCNMVLVRGAASADPLLRTADPVDPADASRSDAISELATRAGAALVSRAD